MSCSSEGGHFVLEKDVGDELRQGNIDDGARTTRGSSRRRSSHKVKVLERGIFFVGFGDVSRK